LNVAIQAIDIIYIMLNLDSSNSGNITYNIPFHRYCIIQCTIYTKYTHKHTHRYIYICTHTYIHTYIYAYIHIHIHTHIYIYSILMWVKQSSNIPQASPNGWSPGLERWQRMHAILVPEPRFSTGFETEHGRGRSPDYGD
jgi:hypothetical protein